MQGIQIRLWYGLADSVSSRSLESGDQFCVAAFGTNMAPVTVKMFSYLIYFIKKLYKCCSFNVICTDNVAINCNTTQHKQGLFPSTLMGHTTLH